MRFTACVVVLITMCLTDCAKASFLECEVESDCPATDATCYNDLCQCPLGKTLSLDGKQCLKIVLQHGESCTDDAQCAPLLGKNICKSGICQCANNYRYHSGMCIPAAKYGKYCTKNEDCFVSPDPFAMVCDSSKCVCNEGYYLRGDYDCRPLAKKLRDPCAMDSDCQNIPDSYCNNGCVEISNKSKSSEENIMKVVTKKEGHERDNLTSVTVLAISCEINEDCLEVPNSYCSPLTKDCVCKRGYFYHSTKGCIGELGTVSCDAESPCSTPEICVNDVCVCPTSHYYTPELNKCVKAASKVNDRHKCNSDLACSVLGLEATCVAESVFDSYCQCNFGTELDSNSLCVDTMACLTRCKEPEDCDMVNAICVKGECLCPDNYRLEENVCLPNLGALCNDDTRLCQINNSECTSNHICSCIEGYIESYPTTCHKIAGLHEECSVPLQCVGTNTECKEGRCECTAGYQEVDGFCIERKVMGDYCTNVQQCYATLGTNVMCRNSMCQCATDWQPTDDLFDCTPRNLGNNIHFYYEKILMFATFFVLLA